MAHTPLYKRLKNRGTSFYAFPGAAEDISASYQNENFRMYFSNYVLLNFPKQNLSSDGATNSIYFNFGTFSVSELSSPADDYSDSLIESLRNYVANFEVVMKSSKLNNTEFYYDHNDTTTPTEKIFWKWCKKLNLFDLEVASDSDEYFGNLQEFGRNNLTNDEYFREYLWREREIFDYETVTFYETSNPSHTGKLEIEIKGATTLKVGDIIEFIDPSSYTSGDLARDSGLTTLISSLSLARCKVVYKTTSSGNDIIIVDLYVAAALNPNLSSTINLVYHRLVQYIGNVNGVNNVQESDRSYTEVWAQIPDNTGQTPDVLFRTRVDKNYRPGISFPILPIQIQAEIAGAENFKNPIVNSPQDYPGSYFGQFDNSFYTYQISTGDPSRRRGDFFGISGDINNFSVSSSKLDGLTVDFDRDHYVKMNSRNQEIRTFDEFNMLNVNGDSPKDFEFNAILWYYDVLDSSGNISKNLYGITFLDNPNSNPLPSEVGYRLPTLSKLCANSNQDGVSDAFNLILNFQITNDNPQDTYNPDAINSLFNFNLFNEAMRKLSGANKSFLQILIDQGRIQDEILNLKTLLYSQTQVDEINQKINFLENLLRLYSSNQIVGSDTISVRSVIQGGNSYVALDSIDGKYNPVEVVRTTDMFNVSGPVSYLIKPSQNKDFLLKVINDDINPQFLGQNIRLNLTIDRDLDFGQTVDIIVDSSDTATQNKQLDIFIRTDFALSPLTQGLELPIYYNISTNATNTAKKFKNFGFSPNFNQNVLLFSDYSLLVPFYEPNTLIKKTMKVGDYVLFEDFVVGSASTVDFSGQYKLLNIDANDPKMWFDLSDNPIVTNYIFGSGISFPICLDNYLCNAFTIKYNKGYKISITRTAKRLTGNVSNDYQIVTQKFYEDKI